MHHIVDPRTSRPADGPWRTVSVAAESALEANVCSTAAIVLGDRALAWLRAQAWPPGWSTSDGRVTVLGGWPADEPRPPSRPRPSVQPVAMILWYLARAAGITAFACLSLATGLGALTARNGRRPSAGRRGRAPGGLAVRPPGGGAGRRER